MENKTLDIVNIIEKTPLNFITESYKCKMIEKINKNFTSKEQQLFIASFYCYLNYNSKTEFIIDFDTVWKWCGFTRKDNAKRLLQKKFNKDTEYVIYLIQNKENQPAPPKRGAGFKDVNLVNNDELQNTYKIMNKKSLVEICRNNKIKSSGSKDEIIKRLVINETSEDKEKYNLGGSGLNKEQIMLSVNTFKKFCLKAGTKQADEVHEYYIKLENFLQEVILEEKKELEEEKKELEYKTLSLKLEQNVSQNLIKELNKKLERKQKAKYALKNCVYIISNNLFKGYFKIGKSSSFNNRMNSYTSGAPTEYNVDYLCKVRNKSEETAIENMVLQILGKYRIKNHMDQDREWLHGVDLKTIKKEMNNCVKFMNERREKYEKIDDVNKVEIEQIQNKIENNDYEEENSETSNIEDNHSNEEIASDNLEDDNTDEDNIEDDNTDEDDIEEDTEQEQEDDIDSEIDMHDKKKTNISKKQNTKYNLTEKEIRDKNNPADFKKFIKDCCEIDNEEFYVIQSELKLAYKIWCRTPLKSDKSFMKYMKDNYHDTRIFIDDQRRHVFKGLKLKPLIYTKTKYNFDFEEFIEKKCKTDYLYKISYVDFIHFFTEWKKQTDSSFKLNKNDQMNIKEILESFFCRGRVLASVKSKTKNLYGVLGLGLKENNYGIVEKKRQNKIVKEYDIHTNKVIKEYDSIISCANHLNIPFSTFSNHIRNQTVLNDKYYKI